jgi:hypothetical protein
VNQGGEPGHDDYGLPRIDIEVPDDARELDRDVQAYYRELRALRRHQRSRRWRAPIRRSGVLMPLVAGCLLVAMLSGMVLTMFSANSYISGLTGQQTRGAGGAGHGPGASHGATAPTMSASGQRPASSSAGGPGSWAPTLRAGAFLPDRTIAVAGRPVALRTLTSAALAIIPAACRCALAVRELLAEAGKVGVAVYLIGPPGSRAAMAKLAASSRPRTALMATDTGNVLAAAYHPVGLTVLLVDYRGIVTVSPGLLRGPQLARRLASLIRPGG